MRSLTHFGIVLTIALMSMASRLSAQDTRYDREGQPHMQAALQHLREAAEELQRGIKTRAGIASRL